MSRQPTPAIVYLSGHLRGATRRLAGERLHVGTCDDAEIRVEAHELPPDTADAFPEGHLAALVLQGETYELEVYPGAEVWVNGAKVERRVLASGDLLEIGEGGPVLRFRLYKAGSHGYKSMAEAFADSRETARRGGRTALQRLGLLLAGAPRELATQTSPFFRLTVSVLLVALLGLAGTLWYQNVRLERHLLEDRGRIEGLAELLERRERSMFTAEDLDEARQSLDHRISDTLARVEALEIRSRARQRVISAADRSVVFLQGSFGFVEAESGRPLRLSAAPTADAPPPTVTLEGSGPPAEMFFTGTGFIATGEGRLLTNRHVAVPWEYDEIALEIVERGFRPAMLRFRGFLADRRQPFDVELIRASETADVALLRCEIPPGQAPPLDLSEVSVRPGQEVIVLGYPTGIQALLARVDETALQGLMEEGPLDFWQIADALSERGHIAPLATLGIVGQVSPSSVVYDAQTTHGGSGGPVLNLDGRVVAVNSAILPDFGGSNLGVPAENAAALLIAETPAIEAPAEITE